MEKFTPRIQLCIALPQFRCYLGHMVKQRHQPQLARKWQTLLIA
jgi:hypothetical protein